MPLSRRQFLHDSALGVAMLGFAQAAGPLRADPLGLPIGVQLYTVSEELQKDFAGTLRQLAAIGYREVEMAGFPADMSAAALKQAFAEAGLRCRSAHYHLPMLLPDLERQVEFAQALGLEYMICGSPWVADASRFTRAAPDEPPYAPFLRLLESFTLDDWRWNAEQFNKIGERAHRAGLQFGYHNHHVEFKRFDGKVAFDELLRWTDAKLVTIELDCGWVVQAGFDPVDYFKRFPGRFQLLHIKDVDKAKPSAGGFDMAGAAVGRGSIDWKRIFAAAKAAGVKYYYVEQEPPFARPPLEELKTSYEYLHKLQA